MSNPASTTRITKSALMLGSAVALAGLVAASPAHAATRSNPCGGSTKGSKSSRKMSYGTMAKQKMSPSKTNSKANPCSTK